MKINTVGAELLYAEGQIDRYDEVTTHVAHFREHA
jgi:hypothetical protein